MSLGSSWTARAATVALVLLTTCCVHAELPQELDRGSKPRSYELVNAPLGQVLAQLGRDAKLRLQADTLSTYPVTMSLRNVSPGTALWLVAKVSGMNVVLTQTTLYVGMYDGGCGIGPMLDQGSGAKPHGTSFDCGSLRLNTIALTHAPPTLVATEIRKRYPHSGCEVVLAAEGLTRPNSVTLIADNAQYEEIMLLIKSVDKCDCLTETVRIRIPRGEFRDVLKESDEPITVTEDDDGLSAELLSCRRQSFVHLADHLLQKASLIQIPRAPDRR